MILHAITVQNWRNIGRLELRDLDRPLVVLHGPNRTGKSSLVKALRSCLLDDDHDSTKSGLKESIPWQTKLTPEVTIEFETGGCRYRLMKRFSKNKDGSALLERQRAGSDWEPLYRGKEAGREAKVILGLEQSSDGLNQLLWLDQGDTVLPEEPKLKLTLQKRFEEVLGSLLTGRDWDFYNQLKKSCETYFTPNMKPKGASPVSDWEAKRQLADSKVRELKSKLEQTERQRSDFDRLEEEISTSARLVSESRDEVARLETEQEASRQRRSAHALALTQGDIAKRELENAARRADEYRHLKQRLNECAIAQLNAQAAYTAAEQDGQPLAVEGAASADRLLLARASVDRHETRRIELEDRRRLIDLARDQEAVSQKLAQAGGLQKRLEELNGELAQLAAPSKKELDGLRKNRTEAQKSSIQLAAEALQLTVRPSIGGKIDVILDGVSHPATPLQAESAEAWQIRQRAELRIENFGTIEVKRGKEAFELDELARQLEELNRDFDKTVLRFGLDPRSEDVLEQLDDRRSRHAQLTGDLKRGQEELQQIAPEGTGAVEAQQAICQTERTQILARQPELADWVPDMSAYKSLATEFDREARRLKTAVEAAEQESADIQKRLQQADRRLQEVRNLLTQEKARHVAAEEELKRAGDEFTLNQICERARKACSDAEQHVAETALTPAEQTIDERLASARNAFENREDRLRNHRRQSDQLRGELRSLQGLHEDLAAAEAELQHIERQLSEKTLDAASHRTLRTLFETCRDAQVQQTTGAIGTRVLDWARQLGLDEYHGMDFEAGYLPSGFRRLDVGESLRLDLESHGTHEQLALLVRLAVGGLLAKGERQLAILDDPLTHADKIKHRRMQDILQLAAAGSAGTGPSVAGPLQIVILTCHPERFDYLRGALQIDLEQAIVKPQVITGAT